MEVARIGRDLGDLLGALGMSFEGVNGSFRVWGGLTTTFVFSTWDTWDAPNAPD